GLSLSGAHAADYTLDAGRQAATITPKALTLTGLTAENKVYDASTAATITGTAGLSGVLGSDAVNVAGTLSAAFADADAGSNKSITISGLMLAGASASNYSLATWTPHANISQRTLNVTADNQSKTYGDADPSLTFSVGGMGLAGSDTVAGIFVGALSTATGANAGAGTHAISLGSLGIGNGNYQLGTYTAGTLTVAKATLNVNADNKSKTYGDSDPALTYTVDSSELKYSDTAGVVSGLNLSTTTGAAATAGTHAIDFSGGTASNYELMLNDGTLTVRKAALTVNADNKSKVYGDSDPALTYAVNASQLKYSDTAAVVSDIRLGTATGSAATAGTHTIAIGGGTSANYELTLNDATLTVGKALLALSADSKSKVYGDTDPALTYSANASQLKYSDTAGVVSGVSLSTPTGPAATAGTHTIAIKGGVASNYELKLTDGTLSVTKAGLTVIADDKSKTVGEPDPTLTYRIKTEQLKYADTTAVVNGVELNAPSGAAVPPGNYPIVASSGTAVNYELQYVDGALTVKPSPAVKAENLSAQVNTINTASTSSTQSTRSPAFTAPTGVTPAGNSGQPGTLSVRDGGVSAARSGSTFSGEVSGGTTGTTTAGTNGTNGTNGSRGGNANGTESGVTNGTPPAGDARPGLAAGTAATASLVQIQPQSQLSVEPARQFQFDAAVNFEKPPEAQVSYTARLADGSALPSWMTLDSASGKITGTPPSGTRTALEVIVTAEVQGGAPATTKLNLRVDPVK
ncbi:MAG TPA: MBG domain-containing protein, partial [Burkholderiaceae bacterium]|nr:MBG domain-containing protein [Burkholderiaceae bacterium]